MAGSEFPQNDPQSIWQNQPTEGLKMSVMELRRKAQQRETKSRLEALSSITAGLIMSVLFAWNFVEANELRVRIGWGVVSISGLYFALQAYKWLWPGRLAPDAAPDTTLLFCRRLLEKRRDYQNKIWRYSGLPFAFVGIAIILVPALIKAPRFLLNAAPFFVLLAIWFAIFLPLRRRRQQRLQQELEELHAYERDNS